MSAAVILAAGAGTRFRLGDHDALPGSKLLATLAGRLERHVVAFAQSMSDEPLPIERRIRPVWN